MNGLSTVEAAERLSRIGPNALPEQQSDPVWRRFVRQFNSPLIFILLFALAFDLGLWVYEGAHGWPIAIALILVFNAALGLYQEQRSEAALARLKDLAGAQAWVLRDGELVRLPAQDLVPGDWVRLEAGDRVPTDGTLKDAHGAPRRVGSDWRVGPGRQGNRRGGESIQKFLRFPFSTNLSEVLLVASGAVVAFFLDLRDAGGFLLLPLTAAQILWINLLTDGLPALALAFDRTPGVMQQKPRPANAPLLDHGSVRFVIGVGSMKAALALGLLGLMPMLGHSLEVTRAVAFHFMAVGQLLLTYPSRHTWMRPLPNRYLHAAVLGGIGLQFAAATLPGVSGLLGNAAIPVELWAVVFGGALLSRGMAEAVSPFVWRNAGPRVGR